MESSFRVPAVAGLFYPDDPQQCQQEVARLLATGGERAGQPYSVGAVIAPHAGYLDSGVLAARACPVLAGAEASSDIVAILGPNHRVPLNGIAIDDHTTFVTPLGEVPVATEVLAALMTSPGVHVSRLAHRQEHCIEVQLPFLQSLLGRFRIVPILVGQGDVGTTADLIARLRGEFQARILISSDLSHFLPYDEAVCADTETSAAIVRLASDIQPHQACGCAAINGMNAYALRRGWRARVLELNNSGDTSSDRSRVVGYGAYTYAAA